MFSPEVAFVRIVSVLLLCVASLSGKEPLFLEDFPDSKEKVRTFADLGIAEFRKNVIRFGNQIPSSLTFADTAQEWGNIIDPLFAKGVVLAFLSFTTDKKEVIESGTEEMLRIQSCLDTTLQDLKPLSVFLSYAENDSTRQSMTPYERHITIKMLETIREESLQDKVAALRTRLASLPNEPFLREKGSYPSKTLPKEKAITVLNWNVCLFDSLISLLFGGVIPGKSRVDAIAGKLLELDPDILCLQEVFSGEIGKILTEKLRSRYHCFYTGIGPNPPGFSLRNLGIPAGLFVASKYPLSDESFTPYTGDQTPEHRKYGFFTVTIRSGNTPLAKLITTHLQPGSSSSDSGYRSKQIQALLSGLQQETLPVFLCGDFNILKGGEEAKTLFAPFSSGSYTGSEWTCCDLRDYWWKSRRNPEVFLSLPPDKEWLDYFFLFNAGTSVSTTTRVIEVNALSAPETSLSDHQILLTDIVFR